MADEGPSNPRDGEPAAGSEGRGPNGTEGDDVDPGAPLSELADLEGEAAPGFERAVKGRINRRLIVSDSADLAIVHAFAALIGYIQMILSMIMGTRPRGEEPWRKNSRSNRR